MAPEFYPAQRGLPIADEFRVLYNRGNWQDAERQAIAGVLGLSNFAPKSAPDSIPRWSEDVMRGPLRMPQIRRYPSDTLPGIMTAIPWRLIIDVAKDLSVTAGLISSFMTIYDRVRKKAPRGVIQVRFDQRFYDVKVGPRVSARDAIRAIEINVASSDPNRKEIMSWEGGRWLTKAELAGLRAARRVKRRTDRPRLR